MGWPFEKASIRSAYSQSGFAVVKSLFNVQQMAEIQKNLSRYVSEIVPNLPAMDVFYEDKVTRDAIRMLPRMSQHDRFFADLLNGEPLRAIAEFVLDSNVVSRDAAYFNKAAKIGQPTPPHQDGFYFHLDPCEAVTLWLALDDVHQQNGCIRYVAGSHQSELRLHARTNVLGFSQSIVDYGCDDDLRREVAICVKPGDLIAHDALTIHRADANRSEQSRRALGFVYFSTRAKVDHDARRRYHEQLARELAADGKI